MITFLSGGTGTPKLIQGFRDIIPDNQISIIANSADDIRIYGLYVSPDIDTIIYLLCNILDTEKFWGIKGDTFHTLEFLGNLGYETWFKIGDKDFSTHIFRTDQIKKGKKLSEITEKIRSNLKIKSRIFPSSDTHIETRIITSVGDDIHFQEFWVKGRGEIEIDKVYIKNIRDAKTPKMALQSIDDDQYVIIGPSNPITSIGPIINLKQIKSKLVKNRQRVIAISPIIGNSPISGPTARLMKTEGYVVSPVEIAKMYQDVCDTFIIDISDKELINPIERETGLTVLTANILFKDTTVAKDLATMILNKGKSL
ncbi:MAG: 2-phospho-L-lactate transferase [Candidatus Heimdallarchaeota archaeon]|nr:2-phospho-L-lactate transferase [Candidatus Heimdallarchaeota archaeon]